MVQKNCSFTLHNHFLKLIIIAVIMANNGRLLPENEGAEPVLLNNDTPKKFFEKDSSESNISILEDIG